MAWVDTHWQEMTELDQRRIEGAEGMFLVHPADAPVTGMRGMQAAAALESFACWFRHRTASGVWVPTLVYAEPILENGVYQGYRGVTRVVQSAPVPALAKSSGSAGWMVSAARWTLLVVLSLFLLAEVSAAGGVEWSREWFAKQTHWRSVNGVIHNTRVSPGWLTRHGEIVEVTNGVVVVERRWMEPVWGGPRAVYKVGEKLVYERSAFTNFTGEAVVGFKASMLAVASGGADWRGERLVLYDGGRTPTEEEIARLRKRMERSKR